ncbi:hypothetical protein FLA_4857 [Filimonas lacunae]|nr:hypothetical protein FLA_4857 [Filimonas lacunae]
MNVPAIFLPLLTKAFKVPAGYLQLPASAQKALTKYPRTLTYLVKILPGE